MGSPWIPKPFLNIKNAVAVTNAGNIRVILEAKILLFRCPNCPLGKLSAGELHRRKFIHRPLAMVAAHDAFRLLVLGLEYTIVEKFDCVWEAEKTDPSEPAFAHVNSLRHSSSSFPLNQSFTTDEIIDLIRSGSMRGLVHANISIPPNRRLELVPTFL